MDWAVTTFQLAGSGGYRPQVTTKHGDGEIAPVTCDLGPAASPVARGHTHIYQENVDLGSIKVRPFIGHNYKTKDFPCPNQQTSIVHS